LYGRVKEGDIKRLVGRMCDKNGNIWGEAGDIIGKAELVPESEREPTREGPFAAFSGSTVDKSGKVVDSKGNVVGRLTEGDPKKLAGREVDADGDVLDKNGNVLGKAERWEEEVEQLDVSKLAGRRVNKDGNV